MKTEKDLEDLKKRLKQVPKYLEDTERLLRLGIEVGLTYYSDTFANGQVKNQFDSIQVETIEDAAFFKPFKSVPTEDVIFLGRGGGLVVGD